MMDGVLCMLYKSQISQTRLNHSNRTAGRLRANQQKSPFDLTLRQPDVSLLCKQSTFPGAESDCLAEACCALPDPLHIRRGEAQPQR